MLVISIELLLKGVDYLYIDIGVCTFESRVISKVSECTGFSIFGWDNSNDLCFVL